MVETVWIETGCPSPSHRTSLRFKGRERYGDRYLSTNGFYVVGRHFVSITVVEMSSQIIHDCSNLIVAHHRSEWRHSALSVDDHVDWISARFKISVARK